MNEDDARFNEQTVELSVGKCKLQGTLTLPLPELSEELVVSDVRSAVLLLPGSGPLDRNQNSVQVQLNIFNDVANHLAGHGIASARFDKRGSGASTGNYDATGHSDFVEDARVCLNYLNMNSSVAGAPIFLLGHSEGSLIAPQLASTHEFVKGQILVTPFIENFENVIRRQAETALDDVANLEGFRGKLIRFFLKLSGDQLAKQRKLIQKIKKSRRDTLKIRKQVINAKWIREMLSLDATAIHAAPNIPTLIIGGQKDLQCRPEDVEKVASVVRGPVQSHVLSDLTHILRADAEKPSVQHYLMLSLEPVDERVLTLISDWLLEQTV